MGFGEFGLEGGQFINENFAGRAQGNPIPLTLASIQIAARQCSGKMPLLNPDIVLLKDNDSVALMAAIIPGFQRGGCSGANYCSR